METILLPILVAFAVASLVYAVGQALRSSLDGSKRKLTQRLNGEGPAGSGGGGDGRAADAEGKPARSIVQSQATGLEARLIRHALFAGIHKSLLQAFPEMKLIRLLQLMAAAAVGPFALVFGLTQSLLVATVAGVVGCYVPLAFVTARRNRRQRVLASQLPEALDFLARVLRAGHSFSTGLQMMGEELPEPLAAEFRRAYAQHSLGVSLEDALKETAERIDSGDFAFFVTATLIQRQTGGDLGEVLGNISGMIRQRSRLQQQVKAKTAEGRFTGYILSGFPAVMFVLVYTMNPEYAGVLVNTTEGVTLLGVALGLQMLGLLAIRKITTVHV